MTFFIIFEQRALHFYFVLSPENHVAGSVVNAKLWYLTAGIKSKKQILGFLQQNNKYLMIEYEENVKIKLWILFSREMMVSPGEHSG